MAPSKPARQCTLIRPSGKPCGSLALRGKPFCYHHNGNHRSLTRERLLCQRLGRLREKLEAMGTASLVNFLYWKLSTLQKTLIRFPEVAYTLTYTLDRLEEITALESILREFLLQIEPAQVRQAHIEHHTGRTMGVRHPQKIARGGEGLHFHTHRAHQPPQRCADSGIVVHDEDYWLLFHAHLYAADASAN